MGHLGYDASSACALDTTASPPWLAENVRWIRHCLAGLRANVNIALVRRVSGLSRLGEPGHHAGTRARRRSVRSVLRVNHAYNPTTNLLACTNLPGRRWSTQNG
jgi:hypothetical protein